MPILFRKMENLAGLWIKYLQDPEKRNTLVARRAEIMAKGSIKRGEAQKKSNKPVEASSAANTKKQNKKTAPALGTDDEGHPLNEGVLAAYKSGIDDLSILEEPYLGIVPAAKRPVAYKTSVPVTNILSKQRLTCLITAVTATTVTTEALIDRRNGIVQTRRFDKLPLLGVVACKEGALFNLTITTRPGSREFLYTPGNAADIKYFEETFVDITSLRNDLKNDPNFQREPDTDDGHTF
jgi:hypothetical protein